MVASFPKRKNDGLICSPSIAFSCPPPSLEKSLCSGLSMKKIGQLGNIDRLASDGEYRLGGCIFIPVGLNFGKELLEDFKTSALFQGSDLENCQKGIKMLRDLMMKTTEKMKRRLPQ